MKRENAHDPRAIANRILDLRDEAGERVTLMQLIKLLYIADGWSMALLGEPLSKERPEAWQYGPVYRSIYNAFNGIGSSPVRTRAAVHGTSLPVVAEFSEDEDRVIRMVVDAYGKLSAFTLSNLTHQADTPWSRAFDKGRYSPIDDADIVEHFDSLKEKRLVRT